MQNSTDAPQGLKRLIKKFRREFRKTENTGFYSDADYKNAERLYIKYRLSGSVDNRMWGVLSRG